MAFYLGSHEVNPYGGQPQGGGGGSVDFGAYLDGSIEDVTVPSGITSIRNDYGLRQLLSLKTLIIPDGVETIGNYLAYNCPKLETLDLPSSVQTIGKYFSGLYNVSNPTSLTIYCRAATPPTLDPYPFYGRSGLIDKIYVPSGSVSAYKSKSGWSTYASYIQAIP